MSIDWSKAPADATHANDCATDQFRKVLGEETFAWDSEGCWFSITRNPNAKYIPRPSAEWDGVGLPPVGTVCETLWSSQQKTYMPVKVVGHDEDRAVVRFTAGERKGEYDSDTQHDRYGVPIFRPIRTAEQIAAENRQHKISGALARINPEVEKWNASLDCSIAIRATVEAMIDAGYSV